ncbi:hypothetical protein J3459_006666 [Metarhizium acridum]|nr:hypothetical protein J3459_006666 [Metarhizium acridum]
MASANGLGRLQTARRTCLMQAGALLTFLPGHLRHFTGLEGDAFVELDSERSAARARNPPKPFRGQIQIARTKAATHSDCLLAHFQGYCCGGALDPDGDIESRGISNNQLLELEFYLKLYDENPTCPVSPGPLRRAASSKGPSALSYTSYMILATILSSVLTVPEVRTDIHRLIEAYFGYSRQVASVEELHDWARSLYDSKGFFADFLCSPIDVTTAIRQANAAERVCVVPTTHLGPRDVSATERISEQETDTHCNKRVFIGPYTVGSLRFESPAHPSVLAALNGVVNGDLTLHYARWLAFRSPQDRGNIDYFGLEIAYWIGPTLGVVPDTTIGNRYASSRAPNARWVVFHVHFERDTYTATDQAIGFGRERGEMEAFRGINMFRRINTRSLATDNYYAGATILNVFHANRVQDFQNADSRVAGEDRIGASAVNHRSTIFECVSEGPENPRPSRWWIGAPAAEGATELESAIARFGQHLVSTGIADMASFSHIYPNARGQASTDLTRMPHRHFAPTTRTDPIFYESWVADAASVDFDDLHERVPHVGTRPMYEDYRDMMPPGRRRPN